MKTRYLAITLTLALGASLSARASGTDENIESAAENSYTFKHYLKHDNVKVEATDGAVTLTGTVKYSDHKMLAEETVAELPTVTRVDNLIKVTGKEPAEKSDDWIFAKVKSVLLFHSHVSANTHVTVKDGIVTLRGKAESDAEKDLTTQYVEGVEGVKSVDNDMTVKPSKHPMKKMEQGIDDASITGEIKVTLWSHRATSATNTHVKTVHGAVTLTGKADNAAEKELVTVLVSHIDGVKSVDNDMTY